MNDPLTVGSDGQTPVHPDDLDGLLLDWISTQGELNDAESDNLDAGLRWAYGRRPSMSTLLDDRFLFELHRQCFGEVWAWAGQPRRRATSIGVDAIEVTRATRDALLDAAAQLEHDAAGERRTTVLASLHHRLAAVHPFANGNGRTLRLHAVLLARALGLPDPTWGAGRDKARRQYLSALRQADGGDPATLERFMWS